MSITPETMSVEELEKVKQCTLDEIKSTKNNPPQECDAFGKFMYNSTLQTLGRMLEANDLWIEDAKERENI